VGVAAKGTGKNGKTNYSGDYQKIMTGHKRGEATSGGPHAGRGKKQPAGFWLGESKNGVLYTAREGGGERKNGSAAARGR